MSNRTAAITGGYLSQNMGATAMTIVSAERLRSLGYDIELYSKYPREDRAFGERYAISLRPANQFFYTLVVLPLLALTTWAPPARRWIRRKCFRNVALFYDVGGITFSDSRGFIGFVINCTWLLLPLLLGVPLIKGSQALGPFRRPYLRLAPYLLRKVSAIYARGAETHGFLQQADIPCRAAADIAFLLQAENAPIPEHPYIAFVPSSVLMKRYDRSHGKGAYLALLAEVVDRLAQDGRKVLIVAHSYRQGATLNNNDLPLATRLAERASSPNVMLYDVRERTPGQLKFVLGNSEVVLTSRFHAMIAALGSCVPVVVTSWSHKYREVLSMFGLEKWAMRWQDMTAENIVSLVLNASAESKAISGAIAHRLPGVISSAARNFEAVLDLGEGHKQYAS